MKYRIALHKSEEGYSVSVPGLPGCWSQGATEQEALENIREDIREYLSVVNEQLRGEDIRESPALRDEAVLRHQPRKPPLAPNGC
jgi:predicted RNase H-like HicB family nuclease